MTGTEINNDHQTIGTLADDDISAMVNEGELIVDGYDSASVKQACYELHASDIFYETSSSRENKRVLVSEEGYVLRPHTYVTAITREALSIPADILARVISKGRLFSVGILPVSTYVDPGFHGKLGITIYNASHRHVVVRSGEPIAKIEFSVLSKKVNRPYSGQHGYETEIWPIPVHLYANDDQLKNVGIDPGSIEEIEQSYGPVVASLERRLNYYEKRVWGHILVTILGFLFLFSIGEGVGWFYAVLVGILANLCTNFIFFLAKERRPSWPFGIGKRRSSKLR